MYIWPRLKTLVASLMRCCTWPCTERGEVPRAWSTPMSFSSILASSLSASCESSRPLVSSRWLRFFHSTSGSCRMVESTLSRASRWLRSCSRASSETRWKAPSTPHMPIACTRFCVSRKGTCSGVARLRPWSNRQAKSTCISDPEVELIRMFSRCRSPSPTAKPIIDMTAHDRVKASRASNQRDGSPNCSISQRWRTGGSSAIRDWMRPASSARRLWAGTAIAAAWRLHHVGHPLDETALLVNWRHRIALHSEPPPTAVGRLAEQAVDGRHEVHHAGVLAQIRAHHVHVVLPRLNPGRVVGEGRGWRAAGAGRLGGGQVGVDRNDERLAGQLVQLREA
eukprot:scaffold11000_cov108-Isochrysis_galbana.AAC.3